MSLTSPNKTKKLVVLGLMSVFFVAVSALVLQNINEEVTYIRGDNTPNYSLTLNSSNKVTSNGDKIIKTALKNDVTFTYSGVSNSTTGHATLSTNGTIVNKDHIRSIESVTANYSTSGDFKFRLSYGGDVWSDYTNMYPGLTFDLGSHPYYIEFKAFTSSIVVDSITIRFTCTENSAAHEGEGTSSGLIGVFDLWDSDSSQDTQSNVAYDDDKLLDSSYDSLQSNRKKVTLATSASITNCYDRTGGIAISSSKNAGSFTLDLASGVNPSKVSVEAAYTKSSGATISLNGTSRSLTTTYTSVTSNPTTQAQSVEWTVSNVTELSFSSTSGNGRTVIYRIYLYGETGPSYDVPGTPAKMEVGFSATDSKASTYETTDIFDNDNGLVVKANYNDGSTTTLSKGADGYSYVVKDSNNNPIDTSKPFGGTTDGTYTLIVSYKNYIPVEITLNTKFIVVLTDISNLSSSKTVFNTAEKLEGNLAGLTCTLTYNNNTSETVTYANFANKNLVVTLLDPNGVTYSQSSLFGTAGTWKIKVSSSTNPSIYEEMDITVEAIPVVSVALSESELTLEIGKKAQLTVTVNPTNATNPNVEWSSANSDVATVDDSGKVTAVSEGVTSIKATAKDGSGVFGQCSVTVIKPADAPDQGLFVLNNSGAPAVGSYVVIANATSSGSGYAMSLTQNENNRRGEEVTVSEETITRDSNSSFAAFRVENGTTSGSVAFYDEVNDGYLYAASSSSNYLRTETTLTANSSWTISGSEGKTITAQGSNSRKIMRWNTNSKLFSCYASGQAAPYIFEKSGEAVYASYITLTGDNSVAVGSTTSLSVSFYPANTTVKAVTWTSSDDTVLSVNNGVLTGLKAGTATITASVKGANNTTVSESKTITVSNVSVESVSLNTNSTSINVGESKTLVATINPSNATNKNVTWSTSDNSVAIVDSGVVTALSAGTADITVKTEDGNKTAKCTVTVTSSGGGSATAETFTITTSDFVSGGYNPNNGSHSKVGSENTTLEYTTNDVCLQDGVIQFKKGTGYLYNETSVQLDSITISGLTAGEFTVYGGTTQNPTSDAIYNSNNTYDLSGYTYFKIKANSGAAAKITGITITTGAPAPATPVDPTSIQVSPSSIELSKGGSQQLSVSYTPSNANQNKNVTWTSSNNNVASVSSSGKVTVSSTASEGATATITATLTNLPTIKSTCTVTVTATQKDDHTVLIYMCGADLESSYASSNEGLATSDITEILKISGQPDDVNIIIETGGASKWSSTYNISSSYLQRHHVANRSLVRDSSLTYESMGLSSTLQSFIEYGLENYPANRVGLVLWNHGGGMQGVCYDEKKNNNSLLDYEVKNAVTGALSATGQSGSKLEWIGYDACLMQVQDIAEMNSAYANYMIASEESEAGYGWDYDTWVDDLYAKKSTGNILKAIVDGFIADNGGTSSSGNDQTLSYLDLSYASAYKTAWENMATQLSNKITSNNKPSFNNLVKTAKHYADTDYTYFGLFDAKDFINKLASNSTFNPGSTYTNAVINAHSNLVAYSSCGKGAGNSYGLCMFWAVSSNCYKSTYYTSSMTNFSVWRSIVSTYGN